MKIVKIKFKITKVNKGLKEIHRYRKNNNKKTALRLLNLTIKIKIDLLQNKKLSRCNKWPY